MRNIALDGVRGIAIILVLVDHWAPNMIVHNTGDWGRMGLLLFFLLSGYLISNMLLQYVDEVDSGNVTNSKALKVFYLRRSLRIFPLYYIAVLVVAFSIPIGIFNKFSHVFFFQNIAAAFQPVGYFGCAVHLWSLAVEEQFYIFWAPIVLYCSPITRNKVGFGLIILAACFKVYCVISGESLWFMRLMTFGNIEGFAIGAFMAIGRRDARFTKIFTLLYRIVVIIGPLIVLGFAVTTYAYGYLRVRNNPYYSQKHLIFEKNIIF